jgi:hypothetical protein
MTYADYDPEDAFDAMDSVIAILQNVIARIRYFADHEADADLKARAERVLDDLALARAHVITRDHLDDPP